MEYWEEAVRVALEDADIIATEAQIIIIMKSIKISHDCYSMAHGYDFISNPLTNEIDELKEELYRHKNKRICTECKGRGYHTECYGTLSSPTNCFHCNGEGFIYPA